MSLAAIQNELSTEISGEDAHLPSEGHSRGNPVADATPRYEAILDPLDQYLIWDHKTGMPAVIQGIVLYGLTNGDEAKGLAAVLNSGSVLTPSFIEALVGEEALHKEETAHEKAPQTAPSLRL